MLLSLHGQDKDALTKSKAGAWEYDIVAPLYKCNMTDVMAAIGLKQLERYSSLLKKRRNIIKKYDEMCDSLGIIHLDHYTDEYMSSGHLYLTRILGITEENRNKIIDQMAERGIACNVHYKPLPMHTAYKKLGFDISDYPNAFAQYANEVTLPLHTCLDDEDVEYIVKNYGEYIVWEPEPSYSAGYYNEIIPLKLTSKTSGTIYYTLDGQESFMSIFETDGLLVIKVGYSDEGPKFIAYE